MIELTMNTKTTERRIGSQSAVNAVMSGLLFRTSLIIAERLRYASLLEKELNFANCSPDDRRSRRLRRNRGCSANGSRHVVQWNEVAARRTVSRRPIRSRD